MNQVEYKNILIVKLSAIGDVIHALPVASALRECFSAARISWVVEKPAYDILRNNPAIDEIIIFDKPKCKKMQGLLGYAPGFIADLRRRKFDLALDLQGLFKSSIIAWLSGAKKRYTVHHAKEGAWLLCERVKGQHFAGHIVERYLDVARAAGCIVDQAKWAFMLDDAEQAVVDHALGECCVANKKIAVIAPGANWPNKRWPTGYFAQLADFLAARGITTVTIGGAGDQRLYDEIAASAKCQIFSLIGQTTLKQLAGILKEASLFVGGDTGPTHLAAAVGTPTVEIMGPTDNNRNGPYGDYNLGLEVDYDCAACWQRKCPLDKDCLAGISVEQVIKACELVWTNHPFSKRRFAD